MTSVALEVISKVQSMPLIDQNVELILQRITSTPQRVTMVAQRGTGSAVHE